MVTAVCQNPLLALAGSGMAAHPTVKVILGVPEDRDATTKVFGAFKGGTCLKVQNILLTKKHLELLEEHQFKKTPCTTSM